MNQRTVSSAAESQARFTQVKGATLDYHVDWRAQLGTDTISTSTWASDTATLAGSSNASNIATILVSGGDEGDEHEITNTVTTAAGITDVRTITVVVGG